MKFFLNRKKSLSLEIKVIQWNTLNIPNWVNMMKNLGSPVQIGIRDNQLKLCEKERNKEKSFFSLWRQMREF